ncbi:hypothetical protein [Pseudomonas mangrovi]|uniref:hypothetical protein n=1 Tax=Pseudomonas mangrovi TaxID=2161748 RepID=UPI0011B1D052|nr:hypothetical protein [Pseudomonas mangrovi]
MHAKKFLVTLAILFSFGCSTPSPSQVKQSFDINAAIQKAGQLASPEQTEMYMFYLPEGTSVDSVKSKLTVLLKQAATTRATVAVIGPDFNLSYNTLNSTLVDLETDDLKGAEIIYLGAQAHFRELENLSNLKGASFKATSFP